MNEHNKGDRYKGEATTRKEFGEDQQTLFLQAMILPQKEQYRTFSLEEPFFSAME